MQKVDSILLFWPCSAITKHLKIITGGDKCCKAKEGWAVRENNRESKLPAGIF